MSIFKQIGTNIEGYTLDQATKTARLDWNVDKRPIWTIDKDGKATSTSKFFATTRNDTNEILGIVGPDYQVVQNSELAWLCQRVSSTDAVVETAGYLRSGARVWYQMRGNPFGVGTKKDENIPYCVFSNGHDGQHPISALPTSIRVICENTLNMAHSNAARDGMIISLRHTGDMTGRLEAMAKSIELFKESTERFKSQANTLANKEVTTQFVQDFWTKVYMRCVDNIPYNATSDREKEQQAKAESTVMKWSNTFDSEVKHSGANLWTAFNAVTSWIDHDQIYRGNNKAHNKFNDTVYGKRAKEKVGIFNYALQFAS